MKPTQNHIRKRPFNLELSVLAQRSCLAQKIGNQTEEQTDNNPHRSTVKCPRMNLKNRFELDGGELTKLLRSVCLSSTELHH